MYLLIDQNEETLHFFYFSKANTKAISVQGGGLQRTSDTTSTKIKGHSVLFFAKLRLTTTWENTIVSFPEVGFSQAFLSLTGMYVNVNF